MGTYRVTWLVGAALVLAVAPARAEPVAVADFYGEPSVREHAGATALLVRSMLDSRESPVVDRESLWRAVGSVGGDHRAIAIAVRADEVADVLAVVRAAHLVAGTVARRGARLWAAVQVFDAAGGVVAAFTATAPYGDVTALAREIAERVAAVTGGSPRRAPQAETGQLAPFVRAHLALLALDAEAAASALLGADGVTAGRVPAARDIAEAVWRRDSLPLEVRLQATLVAVAPDETLALAERAGKDPVAGAGRARAKLAALDVVGAEQALAEAGRGKQPALLLARAELAHRKSDRQGRDDALAPLLASPAYVPALAFVATLPPSALPAELEQRALAAAADIAGAHPMLGSRLALRAAEGDASSRALALVRPIDLDERERKQATTLAEAAISAGDAAGFRLAAGLAIRDGNLKRAQRLVERGRAEHDDRGLDQLAGWLLEEGGDFAAAAQAYANADDQPARAQALLAAGDRDGATAVLAGAPDDASVASLRARSREVLRAGDDTAAVLLLERALLLAPNDPELLRELADALGEAGNPVRADRLRAVAAKLEAAAGAPVRGAAELAASSPDGEEGAQARSPVASPVSENAELVADELGGLIEAFPLLTGGAIKRVVLAPLAGSAESFWYPYQVRPALLAAGLERALAARTLAAAVEPTEPFAEPLPPDRLDELAREAQAGGVLLYGLRASGAKAKVRLVLYDPVKRIAPAIDETIRGKPLGLVVWNRTFLGMLGAIAAVLMAALGYRLLRGVGHIAVRVKRDPAAEDDAFCLAVARSSVRPAVEALEAFSSRVRGGGYKLGRRSAAMIGPVSEFALPPGTWWVHLYGTYKKGAQLRSLTEEHSVKVKTRRGRVVSVEFDLVPSGAEYRFHIFDEHEPVHGAVIAVEGLAAGAARTDKSGDALLVIPKGTHRLRIDAKGLTVDRRVHVTDTRVHDVHINLQRERRIAELSGGVSIEGASVEQADHRVIDLEAVPATAAPAPAAAAAPAAAEAAKAANAANAVAAPSNAPIAGSAVGAVGTPPPALVATASAMNSGGLQRYQLVAELGRGAMGVVYKARDAVLERDVALKIIADEMRQYPVALQMFMQEAKALAQLNHPNIVTVFDQGQDDNQAFMVMEFVEGKTLEAYLEGATSLPLSRALGVADQLCAGLAYAHGKKVIHRDIKPANIFVTNEGVVKLGDFGLARVVNEIKIQRTEIRGTPLYMAPEQIRGTDIDFRADLYAVGCTLYELCTGRPPFIEGEVLYHHMHTEPQPPSAYQADIPPELDRLILKCIRKEVADRVGSAQEIRERLRPLRQRYG